MSSYTSRTSGGRFITNPGNGNRACPQFFLWMAKSFASSVLRNLKRASDYNSASVDRRTVDAFDQAIALLDQDIKRAGERESFRVA